MQQPTYLATLTIHSVFATVDFGLGEKRYELREAGEAAN